MNKSGQDEEKDMLKIFNLKNNLDIHDDEQLKRIKQKLDTLIESKKLEYLFVRQGRGRLENEVYIKPRTIPKEILNEIYFKEIIQKNAIFSALSISAFLYFNRFTTFLNKVNSIFYYKNLFLFTLCFLPVVINYNFSKMNYEYKLLELKLGKKD